MKKINVFVIMFVIAILLSIAAFSQINPITKLPPITDILSKFDQVTPTISLEEKDICIKEFYDEIQDVYGNCVYYVNVTHCLNSSGPNTGCSIKQNEINYQCKTGEISVTKNRTECKPNDEFLISIDQGAVVLKKQIDFSDWGPCIYEEENSCLIVTCQSMYDGANDGQFHGCKGGTSCQRFEICDNSIKTLFKNSRDNFVEDDPSFYLTELPIVEVSE